MLFLVNLEVYYYIVDFKYIEINTWLPHEGQYAWQQSGNTDPSEIERIYNIRKQQTRFY